MNLKKRGKVWIRVIKDYFLSFPPLKGKFLDSQETIKFAIQENKSIIRLGDGEFNLLAGGDVHYQKFDIELQNSMKQIVDAYSKNSPYLLCVPYKYFSNNNLILNKRVLISCWSTPKRMFKKMVAPDLIYGDAFVFAKNNFTMYNQLWKNYSAVIVLHNNKKYLSQAYNEKSQKGYFIQVPNKDSFSKINDIEDEILQLYDSENLTKSDTIILVSAGPMAKVLTYRLSYEGYHVIDCGHIWDDPLEV